MKKMLRACGVLLPLWSACGDPGSTSGTPLTDTSSSDTAGDGLAFDVDVGDWDGENAYQDDDFDDVPDDVDNCLGIYNPNQADADRDQPVFLQRGAGEGDGAFQRFGAHDDDLVP
ncbi:MAG TPA: hypothetical protein PK095_07595, partial [Myxococcota bacterium]|nr:hypothetical protein [Myxococcota bacterium]